MYKIIGNLLLLALFAGASAFTTPSAVPSQNQLKVKASKKALLSLNFTQTASQQLTASWTATGGGPFKVYLYDSNLQILQQVMTNNFSQVFNKLTVGNSYRVGVQDLSGTVSLSGLVLVAY